MDLNQLEARHRHGGGWHGHHSRHGNSPAVPIVGIIFGSGVIIFALTGIFALVKIHLERKAANKPCNGNCRCQGSKPLETPPPYANDEDLEQQRGLLDCEDGEDDESENKPHVLK